MLLAIDVGNSNIVLGVFDKHGILLFNARIASDEQKTEDQYAIDMRDLLRLYNIDEKDINGSILSSVVPPITGPLSRAVFKLLGKLPLVVGPGIKTGLHIAIDNPAQLGSDMVVDAVSAITKYPKPVIVIDMGTATTISVIGKEGTFLGGIIIPGVKIALTALSERTAQLPHISIEKPARVVGTNTVDSMRSGIIYGNAGMIDSMIGLIESEVGEIATVVATGGLAREIVAECKRNIIFDPDLLMEGLYILYKKNKG